MSLGVFFIHAILHSKWVVAKLLYISMGRDGGVNTLGIEPVTSRTGQSNAIDIMPRRSQFCITYLIKSE